MPTEPGILGAMKGKKSGETIAIIGAGRLGSSLARSLDEARYQITEIVCRQNPRSLAKAARLAREVKARVSFVRRAALDADVIWFCVPDSEIAAVAATLTGRDLLSKIALHPSGVLSSDVLQCLRERGAYVASVHPLMTFVDGSQPALEGVPFAIEGDAAAERVARGIVKKLGGRAFKIRSHEKDAYHAFATMVCPLLISLLATSENVAAVAGMSAREARRRMLPIVRQTLVNYEQLGAVTSFSGPIVRGDVATIERHLKALNKTPEGKRVYSALAAAALKFLPSGNSKAIARLVGAPSRTNRRKQKLSR